MENLRHHEEQGQKRPNTRGKVMKPAKETKNQCNKAGTISSRTSAEIIDEIAVRRKTALEILANS